jgi:hypothetical protein
MFKDIPTSSTYMGFTRGTSKKCLLALLFNFFVSQCGVEGMMILEAYNTSSGSLRKLCSFAGALWMVRS